MKIEVLVLLVFVVVSAANRAAAQATHE